MIIREFNSTTKDIQGIVQLINQFDNLPQAIIFEDIQQSISILDKEKSVIFFIEENDQIIGYAFLTEVIFVGFGKFIELQQILIDKDYRKKGIGKKLLKRCEEWTIEKGYNKIILSSRVHLENAHHFYEKLGYRIVRQSYFFQKELI